jgi:hypothetical protein
MIARFHVQNALPPTDRTACRKPGDSAAGNFTNTFFKKTTCLRIPVSRDKTKKHRCSTFVGERCLMFTDMDSL